MFIDNAYRKYKRIWTQIGGALLLFYIIFVLREYVCMFFEETFISLISYKAGEIAREVSGGVMYFAAFTLPVLFFKLLSYRRVEMPDMQLNINLPKILWLVIPAAVAVNLVFSTLNSMIMLPFNYEVIYEQMTPSYPNGFYLYHLVLDVIGTAVIPAVCEELLFRGFILMALLPYGKKVAVFGSAVMFALMHQNFGQLLYTFGMGIILALIVIETRSIWGGILLHFFNNLFSVVNMALFASFPEIKANLLSNILVFTVLAVGFVCLVILVVKYARSDMDLFYEKEVELDDFDRLYSERAPLKPKEKVRGFFCITNIVFIGLALMQMILLLIVAIMEIPL